MAIIAWWSPPLIAIFLAAVSLPLIAHSLSIFDTSHSVSNGQPFLAGSDPRRWTAAAGAAILSAVVAGTIGAPAVRRHLVTGAVFTFLLALMAAIATLPVMPALVGDHTGEVLFCLDSCSAIVDSGDASSGLRAAPLFAFAPFIEPVAVAVLAVGVGVWSLVVRRLSDAASPRR
jgi:hypothetical protein